MKWRTYVQSIGVPMKKGGPPTRKLCLQCIHEGYWWTVEARWEQFINGRWEAKP